MIGHLAFLVNERLYTLYFSKFFHVVICTSRAAVFSENKEGDATGQQGDSFRLVSVLQYIALFG